MLGHRHLPSRLDGHGGGPVVLYGRAGDRVLVDDRSSGRLSVPADSLAAARARVGSYRHRLVTIDPALVELDAARLRAAVEQGLALQVEHLRSSSDSFGLPAWRKWARMLTARGAKAWPVVFADGRGLGSATASTYTGAAEGARLRALYADFLDAAATLVERPALRGAASAWRSAAGAWERVADVALAPGDELRELIDASSAAIARGDGAREEAARLAGERWALQARRDEPRPAPGFGALAQAVAAVHDAEAAAVEAQV